jgi:hypothetical protein
MNRVNARVNAEGAQGVERLASAARLVFSMRSMCLYRAARNTSF